MRFKGSLTDAPLDAADETDDSKLEIAEEALLSAELAPEEREDAPSEAVKEAPAAPPRPKIVVEPIGVVIVDDPLVSTEMMGEVVMADDSAEAAEDPPAPTTE